MIVCGVDPGANGGVVLLDTSMQRLVTAIRMPVLKAGKPRVDVMPLIRVMRMADAVVVEDVHAMPKQGVSSSFQFGRMLGMVEAAAMSIPLPVHRVTPAVWKKHHRLTRDKRASLDLAAVLYPDACDWRVLANEGVAEAALIAKWWSDKRLG